jgi:predicted choloylglycine hydrolase
MCSNLEIISIFIEKQLVNKSTLITGITYLGFLFFIACNSTAANQTEELKKLVEDSVQLEVADTNELIFIENIPVAPIAGSGYSAGYRHGLMLKDQIGEVVEILHTEILKTGTAKGEFVTPLFVEQSKALEKFIPATFKDEMRGIADASGATYQEILLINTYDDIANLMGCSSIAMPKTKKNELFFHARNLDYPFDLLADKNVIYRYLEQSVISVTFPGYIGALTGTNRAGISLSSHTSHSADNEVGIPSGILYRMILENATTIGQVDSMLRSNQRTIGNNLVISSLNENKVAVFEITAAAVVQLPSDERAVCTNHFVSDELGYPIDPSSGSFLRYDYLNKAFKNQSVVLESIVKTMSYCEENASEHWASVSNEGTVQSVIFLPELHLIYVAKGTEAPTTAGGFICYDYGAW